MFVPVTLAAPALPSSLKVWLLPHLTTPRLHSWSLSRLRSRGSKSSAYGGGSTGGQKDDIVESFRAMLEVQSKAPDSKDVRMRDMIMLGWENCKKRAIVDMPNATPFRIATILHCCNKGKFVDDQLIVSTLERVLNDKQMSPKFAAIGVSISIQSLGCLARYVRLDHPGSEYEFETAARSFAVLLLGDCHKSKSFRLNAFSPRNLSAVMHGLGLLCHVQSGGTLETCLVEAAEEMLREFVFKMRRFPFLDKDVACILHGCANLQLSPSSCFSNITELLKFSLAAKKEFGSYGLSNTVWALGKLNFRNESILTQLGTEIVQDSCLSQHNPQALSNIVYAFGLLEFANAEILRKIYVPLTQEQVMTEYNEQELGNIVYGLGRVSCTDAKVIEAFGREICKENRLSSISTQGLANIIYAFGRAQFFDGSMCFILLSKCQSVMDLFNPQELMCIVYGLALVRDKVLSSRMQSCVLKHLGNVGSQWKSRQAKFSSYCIAITSWSLAELRYYDEEWMEIMLNAYMTHRPIVNQELGMLMMSVARQNHKNDAFLQFCSRFQDNELENMPTVQMICNLVWASAILGILDVPLFLRACAIIDHLHWASATICPQEWRQLLQGWMYLTVVKKEQLDLKGSSKLLVDEAKSQAREMNAAQGASMAESMASEFLTLEGIPHQPGAAVVDGLIIVDILLENTRPQIVVECDGPWHYSYNLQDGNFFTQGFTVLRNKILESAGYKVVTIPYFCNRDEKYSLLKQTIEETSGVEA